MFNARVFSPKKLSAWPDNLDPAVIEPCKAAGVGVKAVQAAIHKAHPAIANHFHSPERIGFRLLNIESNIVVHVPVELAKQGITALPFHDCVMVCTTCPGSPQGDGRSIPPRDWCNASDQANEV